jgi:uncharacterized membrane protein YoaK (UPF0700 family)
MPAAATPPRSTTPERLAVSSLTSACLLAFTGGALDAFLFLNHGKVFAGAMTANAVLSCIALLGHDHHAALHHLIPLAAFVLGVCGEEVLERHIQRHAVAIGLTIEILVFALCSWLPRSFPDGLFIFIITIVCTYQVASFRTVAEYTYNSTFVTGNLRQAFTALHAAAYPESRSEALHEFRHLGLIILWFLLGAVSGALLAPRVGNHTLWLPVTTLTVILLVAIRGNLHASRQK